MKKAFLAVRPAHVDSHRLLSARGEEQLLRLSLDIRARLDTSIPELSVAMLSAPDDDTRATSRMLAQLVGISRGLTLHDACFSRWGGAEARVRSQSLIDRFLHEGVFVIVVPAAERLMELVFYAAHKLAVASYLEEADEGEGLLVMPHGILHIPD